jgi:hypothetical protein
MIMNSLLPYGFLRMNSQLQVRINSQIRYFPIAPGVQLQFAGWTFTDGVKGSALLLPVFVSPVTGFVFALNIGFVPTVVASGVIGTLNKLLAPALIGPGLVHVTVGAVVEHVQPLLVKFVGEVTPLGNVIVVVIMPGAGAFPILATVIGKLLGWPATKAGVGCPIVVVKSGAVAKQTL